MVQYLVKEVNQFPSDIECMRYIATIADKVWKTKIPTYVPIEDYLHYLTEVFNSCLRGHSAGTAEEVSSVHGDHCQSQRSAGGWGEQERQHST